MSTDDWKFKCAARRLALANKELHAARVLALAVAHHDMTNPADPGFADACAAYETALANLIHAAKANGRFPAGNCYGLEARS